jgi:hypothetical protein
LSILILFSYLRFNVLARFCDITSVSSKVDVISITYHRWSLRENEPARNLMHPLNILCSFLKEKVKMYAQTIASAVVRLMSFVRLLLEGP